MNEKIERRTYLGAVSNKMTHMEQGELSAYLRGDLTFNYGFHSDGKPMVFSVREKFMSNEEYENYINNLTKMHDK